MPPVSQKVQEPSEPKKLLLPEKNENNDRIIAYLMGRGIHRDIIGYCIQTGRLYESRDYHNAVFIGLTGMAFINTLLSVGRLANGLWGKSMEAISTSPSLFRPGTNAANCTCLKAPLIYCHTALWNCFPAGTGGRKTACPLRAFICRKRLLRKAPHPPHSCNT